MHVSELDINKIKTNNTATIELESLVGEIFQGRVTTIGLKADESTRSFPVEITVDNPQEKLLPGMVATVSVLSKTPKKLILIPQSAVHSLNNMKVVYIMTDNGVISRTVQTSGIVNDLFVVEKGLIEGDLLIISGTDSEDNGSEL